MLVVTHPTVNAFVRALVEALDRSERLAAFHTTLAFGRRSIALDRRRLVLHPCREVVRLGLRRLGLRGLGPWSVDAVYAALDRAAARSLDGASGVYAYEDGALATFRAARARGLPRFYELPIAYFETVQRILREEAERLPPWAPTLGAPDDSPAKLARKAEECALASLVICPSAFVQSSLPPGLPSIVAEFGSPAPPAALAPFRASGPLRLLFAGAMSQRKGLADLFAALRLLNRPDIELVVMGAPIAPMEFYRRDYPNFRHEPPRPHAQVLALMETCDLLVLPSLVEGRALVQQEALSRGLPLIVTPNAGGGDLILPGVTGWLIPPRDPPALAERLAELADHRAALEPMRAAAQRQAASLSWSRYAAKIIAAIDAISPLS